MPTTTRRAGRLLLSVLLLLPFSGCVEEEELPLVPPGPPRFTNLVIVPRTATPDFDAAVPTGDMEYSVMAHFQETRSETLELRLFIESWANDAFVRVERMEVLPVSASTGTVRFNGTVQVPSCGSIDQLSLFVGLYPTGSANDGWVDADWYFVEVTNAAGTPC